MLQYRTVIHTHIHIHSSIRRLAVHTHISNSASVDKALCHSIRVVGFKNCCCQTVFVYVHHIRFTFRLTFERKALYFVWCIFFFSIVQRSFLSRFIVIFFFVKPYLLNQCCKLFELCGNKQESRRSKWIIVFGGRFY